jgi:hypothetical protein
MVVLASCRGASAAPRLRAGDLIVVTPDSIFNDPQLVTVES